LSAGAFAVIIDLAAGAAKPWRWTRALEESGAGMEAGGGGG